MECFQIKSNKNRTIMITLGRNHFHLFTHNSGHILVLPEIMSLNENKNKIQKSTENKST